MSWTPRQSDIDWTRNLINLLNDGGVWGVPLTNSIYRFDKKAKLCTLVEGPIGDLHWKLGACLLELGWDLNVDPTRPAEPSDSTKP